MSMRVAMFGIYGGVSREYNPGSFMIGWQTYRELSRRLPGARIDVYSFDSGSEYDGLWVEEVDGLKIHFFSRPNALELLDTTLAGYDAVVVGGDNVWQGLPAFLLPSEKIMSSKSPTVVFNCVSSIAPVEAIVANRPAFTAACRRASYVAVRADHLYRTLVHEFGLSNVVQCPDPVLGVDPQALREAAPAVQLPRSDRPLLGVAASPPMVNALIGAFRNLERKLEAFDVWVYPFTRLYLQHEAVARIRAAFGDRFNYIDRTLSPLESFNLVGQFDVSFNDTYHGTIAAIVHGRKFITMRYRDSVSSRRTQLFNSLGMPDDSIPFLSPNGARPSGYASIAPMVVTAGATIPPTLPECRPGRHAEDVARITERLEVLLEKPQEAPADAMQRIRARLDEHFAAVVGAISSARAAA